jgi:hypothetical protein
MLGGSAAAAGIAALAAILDLALGFPFGRWMIMDIAFLLGAGLTLYLAWDAYQDLR